MPMKLEVKNDWTYNTYFLDGVKLDEKMGGVATVRWPNGLLDLVPFRSVGRTTSYGDMGHTNEGYCYDLVADVDHSGMTIPVDLAKLDLEGLVQTTRVDVRTAT